MKSQLKTGALLSYLQLFLNSLISIVYTPLLLRLVGVNDYAIYNLSVASLVVISIFALGLSNSVIKTISQFRGKDQEMSTTLGSFQLLYLALGFICFFLGIMIVIFTSRIFPDLSVADIDKLQKMMIIVTINYSLLTVFGLYSPILLAHERFNYINLCSLLTSLSKPILVVIGLKAGFSVIIIVFVTLLMSLINVILIMTYCFKILNIKIVFSDFQTKVIKSSLLFSFLIFINLLVDRFNWNIDKMLLGRYSINEQIAIYSVAVAFIGYFPGFASAIANVFYSRIMKHLKDKQVDSEINRIFVKVGKIQSIILFYILIGFVFLGQEFILLWVGPQFKSAYHIVLLVTVPMVWYLTHMIGIIVLQAINKFKVKIIIDLIVLCLNIIMTYFLVKPYGAVGCAIATCISFVIGNVIILGFYYSYYIKLSVLELWRSNLVTLIHLMPVGLSYLILTQLDLSISWSVFLMKCAVLTLVYITTLVATPVKTMNIRKMVKIKR